MSTTDEPLPAWKKVVFPLVILAGIAATWSVVNSFRTPQSKAITTEEFKDIFKQADASDREMYEKAMKASKSK